MSNGDNNIQLGSDVTYTKDYLYDEKSNVFRRIYDFIVEFINKIKNGSDNQEISNLEQARKVFEKAMHSQNTKNTMLTNVQNHDTVVGVEAYSVDRKEKWHPDLSKKQLELLRQTIKKDANTSKNVITDTANWLTTRINGMEVFAIYSTENITDPTLLYESKGENAVFERDLLIQIIEVKEHGKSNDGKSSFVNRVFSGDWLRRQDSIQNSTGAVGRGRSNRDAGVLQGQSQREPSRAFRNVIENLFEIRDRVSYSIKDDTAASSATALSDSSPSPISEGAKRLNATGVVKNIDNSDGFMSFETVRTEDGKYVDKPGFGS